MDKKYFLESDTGILIGPFSSRMKALRWYDDAKTHTSPAAAEAMRYVEIASEPDFLSSIKGEMQGLDFVPKVLTQVAFP